MRTKLWGLQLPYFENGRLETGSIWLPHIMLQVRPIPWIRQQYKNAGSRQRWEPIDPRYRYYDCAHNRPHKSQARASYTPNGYLLQWNVNVNVIVAETDNKFGNCHLCLDSIAWEQICTRLLCIVSNFQGHPMKCAAQPSNNHPILYVHLHREHNNMRAFNILWGGGVTALLT